MTRRARGRAPDVRRKSMRLDQRKLDAARKALGASTETETVERALDLVVIHREALEGIRRFSGRGDVREIHGRRVARGA